MKYRILLFCLFTSFFSQGDSRVVCKLDDDQFCSASGLELPDVESISWDDFYFKPFIPRKLKSKAREVLEIPERFIDWYSHFFSQSEFLFVQNCELPGDCDYLFLRGPPCQA